jgi:hypothetical protein
MLRYYTQRLRWQWQHREEDIGERFRQSALDKSVKTLRVMGQTFLGVIVWPLIAMVFWLGIWMGAMWFIHH